MKNQLSFQTSLLVGLCMGLATPAFAELGTIIPASSANGLYGGVNVGIGRNHDLKDAWNDGSLSGQDTDVVEPVVKVYGGYQFNPYVAVQAAFHDLGSHEMSATSSGGTSWSAGSISGKQEADGWSMELSGRWPISERWTLVGTIGWFWWESTETYTLNGAPDGSLKESGSDVTFAGHVEFDHGHKERIVYLAGLDHQQVGDDDYNITTGFAGVIYRFP